MLWLSGPPAYQLPPDEPLRGVHQASIPRPGQAAPPRQEQASRCNQRLPAAPGGLRSPQRPNQVPLHPPTRLLDCPICQAGCLRRSDLSADGPSGCVCLDRATQLRPADCRAAGPRAVPRSQHNERSAPKSTARRAGSTRFRDVQCMQQGVLCGVCIGRAVWRAEWSVSEAERG